MADGDKVGEVEESCSEVYCCVVALIDCLEHVQREWKTKAVLNVDEGSYVMRGLEVKEP